ncbi:response regulator transcription factor [Clostridium fallax]|uniref:Stage 0 sporulation protein A homolog n=1 Tax=Clostridium fallax TaxID=1533 RepID=A0A1M4Z4L7_9CLOT|nr:response regulator transcription factor [Clostridium fallax]SHF12991.1 DNA-binding response regulator, OmpR family, contains REC and winged-helix (wHTH) domain [Clostridium fallax]SQB05899.1 DNA-binding response regulator [Clostridium fallax]
MRILLIEDDLALSIGIEYTLKQENYDVIKKNNLKEGRDSLKENIDLILLDVMLPDGNGYDFCREIRDSKNNIPIIFITACDEEANVVLGLDIGADDYITKPIRIKELLSRINAVIRRNNVEKKLESNKEKVFVSGDIILNPLKANFRKRDKDIMLTPVEYKLILIFLKSKNNALSRDIILEKLWDIDGDFIDSNTLNVYIKRLREKIEDNSKKPKYIETIRGIGYRWAEEILEK